ncbi:uncharacterized protein CTRU02_205707 [Colletotrichum truncatum]|uniref:Uncharacterized protein n=1 Tax=Colletotrichum truncatum TaxID=5467 RepID=A0ACC3Z4T2_COLTU|nr:uncharacterized protein CTRU02_09458 [Colletotrichum truncatum]KAF6788650.1 hypothetical protein CTRU02_09458 [Colletotrichum truncatum]
MPQSSSSSQSKSVNGVVKHRACDECRSRKLACTKEPEGCSRCKREGLRCVYSPQKPMGRPRKRRHVEESEGQSSTTPQGQDQQPQMPLVTQPTLDTDFSTFFNQDFNMDYLDLLSPLNGLPAATLPPELSSLTTMAYTDPRYSTEDFQFGVGGVDLLGGINFDESDSADEELPQDTNKGFTDLLSAQVPDEVDNGSPAASSILSSTIINSTSESPSSAVSNDVNPDSSTENVTVKAYQNTTCSCLSQIFLSLDTLSRLPSDVKVAMGIARQAARVAHDVIHCPACGNNDPTEPPPIQSFQNMMMLGALLPATANAYAKILELVEAETTRAKRENHILTFRFAEYGGLWGEMNIPEDNCGALRTFNNREMDPDQWRLSVRGLLKVDIYGHDFMKTDVTGKMVPYHHLGLKDVIKEMEDRSNHRHDQLDAIVAAGHPHPMMQTPHHLMVPMGKGTSKENRHCLKIIEIARIALDKLVIA